MGVCGIRCLISRGSGGGTLPQQRVRVYCYSVELNIANGFSIRRTGSRRSKLDL